MEDLNILSNTLGSHKNSSVFALRNIYYEGGEYIQSLERGNSLKRNSRKLINYPEKIQSVELLHLYKKSSVLFLYVSGVTFKDLKS